MPTPNPAALDLLLTRRSRPIRSLTTPVPDRATLEKLLTAAMRVPDHGKLEPWRFIVLEKPALDRIAAQVVAYARAKGVEDTQANNYAAQYLTGNLIVAVIESPVDSPKIPAVEQTYSTGAACMALVNAALADGWGSNWLSGWATHEDALMQQALGLADHERVAGLVHIGTDTATPPERPRPDIAQKVTWVAE